MITSLECAQCPTQRTGSSQRAKKLDEYTHIRNVNYLLTNLKTPDANSPADYKQCVGEAYYFRAWYYYQLLISYGGVTLLDAPLEPRRR